MIKKTILIVFFLLALAASLLMIVMLAATALFGSALVKLIADIVFITSIILYYLGKRVRLWKWVVLIACFAHLWVFYAARISPTVIMFMLVFIIPAAIMGFLVSRAKA